MVSHQGFKVVQEELQEHLGRCIQGVRGATTWEEHLIWEARASLLEEMIPLAQTLLEEEVRAEREKLEREKEI